MAVRKMETAMNAIAQIAGATLLKRDAPLASIAAPTRTSSLPFVFDGAKPVFVAVHPSIRSVGIGLAAWFLLVSWLGFSQGEYVLNVALGVCAVLLFMYAAVPTVMGRVGSMRTPNVTLRDFNEGEFDTHTGLISGTEATIQILTVPVCLAVGATWMALLWALAR